MLADMGLRQYGWMHWKVAGMSDVRRLRVMENGRRRMIGLSEVGIFVGFVCGYMGFGGYEESGESGWRGGGI